MTKDICPLCGGEKIESITSFTADYNSGLVVVRDVPAKVCNQCGEEWLSDEATEVLEEIVSSAKKQNQEFLVVKFDKYSLAS